MSDRPRIELNTVQVVASMAAAVTGAVLTSYLGDGGTIVGTAVGSGASTAGFAVYKHYLARTKEKVTPVIVQRARQWGPVSTTQAQAPRGTTQASRGSPADGASPGTPGTGRTQDPATRTEASPYRGANGGNGPTAGRYTSGGAADETRSMNAADAPAWDPGDGQTRDFRRPGFGQPDYRRPDSARFERRIGYVEHTLIHGSAAAENGLRFGQPRKGFGRTADHDLQMRHAKAHGIAFDAGRSLFIDLDRDRAVLRIEQQPFDRNRARARADIPKQFAATRRNAASLRQCGDPNGEGS